MHQSVQVLTCSVLFWAAGPWATRVVCNWWEMKVWDSDTAMQEVAFNYTWSYSCKQHYNEHFYFYHSTILWRREGLCKGVAEWGGVGKKWERKGDIFILKVKSGNSPWECSLAQTHRGTHPTPFRTANHELTLKDNQGQPGTPRSQWNDNTQCTTVLDAGTARY